MLVIIQCDCLVGASPAESISSRLSCPPGQVLLPFVTFYGDPDGGRNVTCGEGEKSLVPLNWGGDLVREKTICRKERVEVSGKYFIRNSQKVPVNNLIKPEWIKYSLVSEHMTEAKEKFQNFRTEGIDFFFLWEKHFNSHSSMRDYQILVNLSK